MYKNLLAVCINFFAFTSNAKAQTVYFVFSRHVMNVTFKRNGHELS